MFLRREAMNISIEGGKITVNSTTNGQGEELCVEELCPNTFIERTSLSPYMRKVLEIVPYLRHIKSVRQRSWRGS